MELVVKNQLHRIIFQLKRNRNNLLMILSYQAQILAGTLIITVP